VLTRRVWVTHRFEGFHSWEGAPAGREYLAHPHRHLFHVRAEVDVDHGDREVEFHDLLDQVVDYCGGLVGLLGSCEAIAEVLAVELERRYPGRRVAVDVSEDGEAGATVTLWRR
jgi:hypothetical protein